MKHRIYQLLIAFICPLLMASVSYATTAVLAIVPSSTTAINIFSSGSESRNYTVTNNSSKTVRNIVIHPNHNILTNLLTVSTTNNTCTGALSAGGSCSFTANLQSKSVTGSTTLMPQVCVFSGLVCSVPIAANRIAVTVTDAPATTLSANTSNALFSFNDNAPTGSGTMGTGKSTLTITNDGSTAASNVAPVMPLPSGITLSNSSCGASLAASGSCQLTFQTFTTPDSTQSIAIKGDNTNTLTLPIAPISVRVFSPPVNPSPSTAALMFVESCTAPQLLAVTNNGSADVTNLTPSVDSGLTGVTINTVINANNCPDSLPENKTCVLSISTGTVTSGSSGNIRLAWNNGSAATGAIFTGVEASGATLPDLSTPSSPVTARGGFVYDRDANCNLVKLAALEDQSPSIQWTTSAFHLITVPNPGTNAGEGARSFTDGQTNATNIVFQAGAGATYAAGLCAQTTTNDAGVTYAGWYLPSDDSLSSVSSNGELGKMYANLKAGQVSGTNGFGNDFYWSSTEDNSFRARFRNFFNDTVNPTDKNTSFRVRCSRALTY